ncbi:putative 7-deoxyloganetin glucosyltransferase [Helianthus anomalus]
MTSGYLETSLDWIPDMNNIRLRDFPSFIRITDINDFLLNYLMNEVEALPRCSAVVLNTFDALELDSVKPLNAWNPRIFTLGPLHLMEQHLQDERVKQLGSNLWKEDVSCIHWLDTKDDGSVVFVNFGSIAVMTKEQLIEFGWGLANSNKDFLWITRPDIVGGNEAVMPPEFLDEIKGRGMITSWCPQEQHAMMGTRPRQRFDSRSASEFSITVHLLQRVLDSCGGCNYTLPVKQVDSRLKIFSGSAKPNSDTKREHGYDNIVLARVGWRACR